MSGRIQPLRGKRRSSKKAPGKKPNAHRQRQLAARKRQYKASALYARREAAQAAAADAAAPAAS